VNGRAAAPRHASVNHPLVQAIVWDPTREAERIRDDVLMFRATSNSYLVASEDGDTVVNTGLDYQAPRIREAFEQLLGRPLAVRTIVFTQHHADHIGGWSVFAEPGTETIAQAFHPEARRDRRVLKDFFAPRLLRVLGSANAANPQLAEHRRAWVETEEPTVTRLVDDADAFETGGRRFELFSTPGGEALDCLVVWLPGEKVVFTGNLTGALHGALPHLYTPRGDRQRSARRFVHDVDRVLALEPELLVTGHGDPVEGTARIRAELTKVRDAVEYIDDRTVGGMNAGKDLWTLMNEVALPPELEPAPGRGPVSWYVRAIWEEHAGWFRQESTTELYGVPPSAVWSELAELAGGPDVLARRAADHLAAGRPVEALHLLDIALGAHPAHVPALEVQVAALELLIDRTRGEPFDELCWLEGELARVRFVLAGR